MQGGVSSKGNMESLKFWKAVLRKEGKEFNEEEEQPDFPEDQKTLATIASVKKAAHDHWDDLVDYKDSIITVYEVEETFPTIFFMQEIKDEVFDVKINCIQVATKKVKEFDFDLREAL